LFIQVIVVIQPPRLTFGSSLRYTGGVTPTQRLKRGMVSGNHRQLRSAHTEMGYAVSLGRGNPEVMAIRLSVSKTLDSIYKLLTCLCYEQAPHAPTAGTGEQPPLPASAPAR
jgi:hypothetical protein